MTKSLEIPEYKPNFNDPRIRRRVNKVLAWSEKYLTSRWAKPIPSGEVRKVFGNTSSNDLALFLRANLLNKVSGYEVGIKFNSYRLSKRGFNRLHKLLGQTAPTVVDVLRKQYSDVLAGAEPEYKDSGLRRYNDFQNIKRQDRKALCAGWWDYDIEACAPTLIHQYAVKGHRMLYGDGPEPYPAVARLVADKAAVRAEVAALTGLDLERAKGLLTMLFFRANTSAFQKNAFYSLLRHDPILRQRVLDDPWIKQFIKDVRTMWSHATFHDGQEYRDTLFSGHKPLVRHKKASKRRMQIYLTLERRVMDVIEQQLMAAGISKVLMHDGFMCRRKVDVVALTQSVKDWTGFEIRISETQLGCSTEPDTDRDVEEVMRGVECDEDDFD